MTRWLALGLLIALLSPLAIGCKTVAFHEKERLQDPAMDPSRDEHILYIRGKIGAAREGGFGGVRAGATGGCGCQ